MVVEYSGSAIDLVHNLCSIAYGGEILASKAVQEAYKRIFPGERVPFGYTTSNSKLQEKLGVKK